MVVLNADAERYKAEGNALFQNKKYTEAVKKYKKATKIDPTNVKYWSNLAYCYDKLNDLEAFQISARKCVALDPTFVKGYYRLGKALNKVWEYDEALRTIQRGLELEATNPDLLQLYIHVNNVKSIQDSMQTELVEGPAADTTTTTNLPYLGGLRAGASATNQIPAESAYGRLKRRPLPPLSKKYKDLSRYDEELRPILQAFFQGSLRIEWSLTTLDGEHEVTSDGPNKLFLVHAYSVDPDNTTAPSTKSAAAPVIALRGYLTRKYGRDMYMCGVQTQQNFHSHRVLPDNERKDLEIVVIQRLLSHIGAQIDDAFLTTLVTNVAGECTKLRMFKDACYLHLIRTDVSVNNGTDDSGMNAVHYGEALESAKLYEDAAKVYVDIAHGRVFPPRSWLPAEQTHGFAGLAFKRAQDYVRAEREYVASIRAAQPTATSCQNLNADSQMNGNLKNMMIYYEIVHRAVMCGFRNDDVHKKMQKACHLLVGLLSNANFKGIGCTLFESASIYQGFIKPEYKTKKKAVRALIAAFTTPTIEAFHTTLFSYQRPYLRTMHMLDPNENMQALLADFLRDQEMKSKVWSREHTQSHGNMMEQVLLCSYCSAPSDSMMECPCKTVRYCGKTCQVSRTTIRLVCKSIEGMFVYLYCCEQWRILSD